MVVEEAGADTVMDLSTGGDLRAIRKAAIGRSSIAVGSVLTARQPSRLFNVNRQLSI